MLVLNNHDLNQVTWEQRVMAGDPKFEGSQNVPEFPYAALRRDARPQGHPRRQTGGSRPRLGRALAADRPVVLEAYTDPNVPPLPPHIKLKQAEAYMSALLHGDPEALGIVRDHP